MRDRLYRRYVEEKKIIKRLKNKTFNYSAWYRDINNLTSGKILISTFLNKKEYFYSKTISTTRSDTNYKKYLKIDNKIKSRNSNKLEFIKILKEYGIE